MRRPVIGLTGGIGTGKSHLRRTLASLGAEGIDADEVAHRVMAPGGPTFDGVVSAFGRDVVAADGCLDRRRLAQRVFADPAALACLEGIVHPEVVRAIGAQVAASKAPLVVIEAIKLLETGLGRALCDRVWVTACSRARQMARLQAGRGMTSDEARRRIASQMASATMIAQADRVFRTDGTMAETELLVLAAWVDLGLSLPAPEVRLGGTADAAGVAAVLNAVVCEGGLTLIDRTFTVARERRFLERLSPRGALVVAWLGDVLAGFQVFEPYAGETAAMAHVARFNTFVAAPARRRGIGRALSRISFAAARARGFAKLITGIRADNPGAQAFHRALGFRLCGRLAGQAAIEGRLLDELLYERSLEDRQGGSA